MSGLCLWRLALVGEAYEGRLVPSAGLGGESLGVVDSGLESSGAGRGTAVRGDVRRLLGAEDSILRTSHLVHGNRRVLIHEIHPFDASITSPAVFVEHGVVGVVGELFVNLEMWGALCATFEILAVEW